ncbi:MAG: hypothetical protein FJZ47_17015 [Candidatus Tectomicrobia bacterium]|uniref:Uncharacterized protein n=1 Tax=Tectimicrobiota bacterium TaxID=2528274 RepID=A0A937W208_UNCTE|nr:hypothetical protein [Candidatus Tectomicrobia bacterium]
MPRRRTHDTEIAAGLQARCHVVHYQCLDRQGADAHLVLHLPPTMTAADVDQVELEVGARCNEVLLDTGLFILSAVSREGVLMHGIRPTPSMLPRSMC